MARFIRILTVTALMFLVIAAPCQTQNAPRVIKEGVGWDQFAVGVNANSLFDVLGFPDKHSEGRMMKWKKAGLNCLLNDKDETIELRFQKPFKGVTESGVTFGMPAEQVRKIYGDAGKVEWRGGGMKLIWPARGVLIWFHGNKVYQIVVFKPQPERAAGK